MSLESRPSRASKFYADIGAGETERKSTVFLSKINKLDKQLAEQYLNVLLFCWQVALYHNQRCGEYVNGYVRPTNLFARNQR